VKRLDDLLLQLKGLVYVRALLESWGAPADDVSAHTDAIECVRAELAELMVAQAGQLET
jgi:hypothetical protein